jgi:hypothetical protein
MKMSELVFATLVLLSASGVLIAQGQQAGVSLLSDSEKADLIESVLELELQAQASVLDFANIRNISADNIEFIEPTRLSKRGFSLVVVRQLRESKKDHVVEYLVFRKIYSRGDAVVIVFIAGDRRPTLLRRGFFPGT